MLRGTQRREAQRKERTQCWTIPSTRQTLRDGEEHSLKHTPCSTLHVRNNDAGDVTSKVLQDLRGLKESEKTGLQKNFIAIKKVSWMSIFQEVAASLRQQERMVAPGCDTCKATVQAPLHNSPCRKLVMENPAHSTMT